MFAKNDLLLTLLRSRLHLLLSKLLFESVCRPYTVSFATVRNSDSCKIHSLKDSADSVVFFSYTHRWYVDSRDSGIFLEFVFFLARISSSFTKYSLPCNDLSKHSEDHPFVYLNSPELCPDNSQNYLQSFQFLGLSLIVF